MEETGLFWHTWEPQRSRPHSQLLAWFLFLARSRPHAHLAGRVCVCVHLRQKGETGFRQQLYGNGITV